MKFSKMHGCGNDYVYVNAIDQKIENPDQLAIQVSNRHFGVGSDGLVLILPSEEQTFRMRMFNSDGSEAEMCGNAIRCVGKFVYDKGLTDQLEITVETLAGIKVLAMQEENGKIVSVTVDMGEPILEAALIPVLSNESPVLNETIWVDGQAFNFTCVSMGNPHAVTYVGDTANFPVEQIGRQIETNELFPRKTNVEFVQIINRDHLKMRVCERGAGETLACGTGACATLVATVLNKKCNRKVTVELLGGNLVIEWDEATNHVFMTGPATLVFDAEWQL